MRLVTNPYPRLIALLALAVAGQVSVGRLIHAQEPDVEVRGVAEAIDSEAEQPLVIVRAAAGEQVAVRFPDKGPLSCIAVGDRIRVLGTLANDLSLNGAVIDTPTCPNPLAELARNTPPLPSQATVGATVQIVGRVAGLNSEAEYPVFLLNGEDGRAYQIFSEDKFPLNSLSLGARVRVRGPKLDDQSIGVASVVVVERFEDNDNG